MFIWSLNTGLTVYNITDAGFCVLFLLCWHDFHGQLATAKKFDFPQAIVNSPVPKAHKMSLSVSASVCPCVCKHFKHEYL